METDACGQTLADQPPLVVVPAALLVVDSQLGMTATASRDCLLLSLMGVRCLGVVVNKMDATGYSQALFDEVARECRAFSALLLLSEVTFIPVAALQGDNVLEPSAKCPGTPVLQCLVFWNPG
ncbi:GTP-binding protein [Halomonas sp. G11]|uniref:GTP-binding protein n=1 Tax=Halomonas sp. G11 TaxID=1684425 RepID=UPI0007FF7566|nr:GTP-binding protein [Halomonas sp. G11]OBA00141.1 hypothetical protein ADS46_12255 [Halomonas sp. G11]